MVMKATKEIIALDKLETPAKKQHGGKRAGAGQPKGNQQIATVVRAMELADIQSSVKLMAKKLVNSQAVAALSAHKMVILDRDENGKVHMTQIRDDNMMQELLDTGEYGKDYVIVEAREGDWKAADALLNRAFGRPKDTIEHKGAVSMVHLIASLDKEHGNSS